MPIDKCGCLIYYVLVSDTYTNLRGVVMATSVKDIIRRRKSVRTFSGEPLHTEHKQKPDKILKALGLV